MPQHPTNPETRRLILQELSDIVHTDFPNHSGTGAFCLGCVAMRSIHALQEVYEEMDDDSEDGEERAINSSPAAKGSVPPVLPNSPASRVSIGDLDEIAQRILDHHKNDDDDGELYSDNLVIN